MIPDVSVNRLLAILQSRFPTLPTTVKTLLKPIPTDIIPMHHGGYAHYDNWIAGLPKFITVNFNEILSCKITLVVNIDGVPLYNKSRFYSAYQILVQVLEFSQKIFCAGIYCSDTVDSKSMPPIEILLKKFSHDIDNLESTCINIDDQYFKVVLGLFVSDAPVHATMKSIASHSGYNSCERFQQHGEYH